jgi:hypothetical protein
MIGRLRVQTDKAGMTDKLEAFNDKQLIVVDQAVHMAEEIVSEYYKMSASQWLRNRYDVRTLSQLTGSEIVFGPFAQLVKYHGKLKESQLGSGGFDFYKICLQDHSIIQAIRENERLSLDPFIIYIIVHELIHIIRFGKFIHSFDATRQQRDTEECIVHQSTVNLLEKNSIRGMREVFEFYGLRPENGY